VNWSTAPGSAGAADFTSVASTRISFGAGITARFVSVATTQDTVGEGLETFTVALGTSVGGVIADSAAVATITDDETSFPQLSVSDVNVDEGSTATFTLTRSGDTAESASVTYATTAGTATSPADYTAVPATSVTFGPGESTKTVNVTTLQNGVDVSVNKTFALTLSAAVNATLADSSATATIVDDDGVVVPGPATFFSTLDARGVEGLDMVFTVQRTGDTTGTSTVKFSTSLSGTATSGTDYTAQALTTLTFLPGETTKTVAVATAADTNSERHETFFLLLTAATNATIQDGTGGATILDND
jgi:hypothetical protein